MRAPGAATGVYALECAMDELAVALKLDPVELRLRCYAERDQNDGLALHQQAAARMLPPGRGGVRLGQAQSRAALDARRQRAGRLGHGDRRLGSAADADGRPHRADRQRPRGGVVRHLRHRHRHLHDHGAGCRRHARPADRECHGQARRLDAAAVAGRGRIMDGGLGRARDRGDRRRGPQGAAAPRAEDAGLAARGPAARRRRARRTA